jgi:type II secretory pathway pseudopilin PulG
MNRIEAGNYVASLEPVYLSALFLAGQALPLVALLGGLAFLRHQRSVSQPDRARLNAAQQAIRQQMAAMDAAMRDHAAGPFFVHARNALQQRYGHLWNMRPEAITVADLDARLGEPGANARTVFEMADQAVYSDLHLGDADLQQWRQVVADELAETK